MSQRWVKASAEQVAATHGSERDQSKPLKHHQQLHWLFAIIIIIIIMITMVLLIWHTINDTVFMPECPAVDLVYRLFEDYVG